MERGNIVERGNHRHLLAEQGPYRRLWDLQNQIFFFNQEIQAHPGFSQICKLSPKNVILLALTNRTCYNNATSPVALQTHDCVVQMHGDLTCTGFA